MVALPKDEKVVVDDAVASISIGEVEGNIGNGVVKEAVEKCTGQLVFEHGVVDDSVAVGEQIHKHGDNAVLPQDG